MTRFDYNASNKESFSVNYLIDDGEKTDPRANANFNQISRARSQVLSLQETHVFSSTLLNTLNGGFTRAYSPVVTSPAVPIPANLAFITGRLPGQITIGGGVSTAAASGIVVANGNDPTANALNLFTGSDDLHLTKGRHSFSLGAWLQRVQENQSGPAQNKSGTVAYQTLLAFLQDSPTAFNANVVVTPLGYRQWEGAWYVQDEMKLRSNLTLRLGLRDEMTNGWNEVAGRCANYRWDQNFVISTETVVGNSCFSSNHAKLLLQPRVGLAWDPTGTGTWAVRAGFGIHNDLIDNLGIRMQPNPPTNAREQFTGRGLLDLIPLQRGVALPPTCGTVGAPPPPACSVYSPAGVDPNLATPTIQQWSLTVQRQITKNMMLEVGYVGSESYHTNIAVNGNGPSPIVCQDAGCITGGATQAGVPCFAYRDINTGEPGWGTLANPVPAGEQRGLGPQGTLHLPPGTRPNVKLPSAV